MSSPDRYAVIGNPISQSKSPLIHAEFARESGQDMVYTAIEGPLGRFAETVDAFRAQGGKGLNVTLPFKLDACAYATELSDDARAAGAANALKFEGDRVRAQNFDGIGLVRDIVHNLGQPLIHKRVLLLGAGGAAVHQFCRIGAHAFIGGLSGVENDVIPYGIALGNRAHLAGLNMVGLKRRGFSREAIQDIRRAYRLLFAEEGTLQERIEDVAGDFANDAIVSEILEFLRAAGNRSICTPRDSKEG